MERDEAVGGQLRLAGHVPAHAETWARYRRLVERDLERAGVELRLGEEATAATADGFDRVVVATGARPFLPALPDLPCRVVDAWTAIREPGSVEGPVLVADWGGEWAGLDAAEAVARLGTPVELATARDRRRGDHPPVPAQPLPGPPRPARRRACARTWSWRSSTARWCCATSSAAAPSRSARSRPWCSRRAASRRTRSGWSSRAGRAWCGRGTCSARARSRRRS